MKVKMLAVLMAGAAAGAAVVAAGAAAEGPHITRNAAGEAEGLFHIRYEQPEIPAGETEAQTGATGAAGASAGENSAPAREDAARGGDAAAAQSALPALSTASLSRAARQFLMGQRELLGVEEAGELELMRATRDAAGGRHLRFARAYRDIPVEAMDVLVHFDTAARVTGINGHIVRLTPALRAAVDARLDGGAPRLSEAAARAFVAADLGVDPEALKVHRIRPLITAADPYLIWEVRAQAGPVPYRYRLSDDAAPRLLSKQPDVRF